MYYDGGDISSIDMDITFLQVQIINTQTSKCKMQSLSVPLVQHSIGATHFSMNSDTIDNDNDDIDSTLVLTNN